jgi:hypothetical protein
MAVLGEAKGGEADIVIEVAVPGRSTPGVLWDEALGAFRLREPVSRSGLAEGAAMVEALLAAALEARGVPSC